MPDHHSQRHQFPGVPLALGSAVLFGTVTPFSKVLLGSIQPVLLAGLMYLGAGVGLAALIFLRRAFGTHSSEAPLRRHDFPWLGAAILMGGVIGPVLLMLGLTHITAASASLLLNLEGLATMTIAWLVFSENVDRRLLIGAASIVSGAVLLSWQGQGVAADSGALLVAGACLAWGIDNNLTRRVAATDPVVIAMLKGLFAGIANIAIGCFYGAAIPPSSTLFASGIIGFLCIGFSLVMFVLALRHLGTTRTGAYYSLAPFIGALVAMAILGEPFSTKLLSQHC